MRETMHGGSGGAGRARGRVGGWMRRAARSLAGACVAAGVCAGSREAAAQVRAAGTALLVSDLHFDALADTSLVKVLRVTPTTGWAAVLRAHGPGVVNSYGSDTNFALLRSAWDAMRRAEPNPRFVVITGDFLAHDYRTRFGQATGDTTQAAFSAFADSTIAFLARWADSYYPRVPIFPSVGNNDTDCQNYIPVPGGGFLRSMARAWAPLANRNGAAPGFARSFAAAGYYTARLPGAGARLVMLNDIFWSPRYHPCTAGAADAGRAELAWLAHTLDTTRAPAWLAAHIPPGVDVFQTLGKGACAAGPQVTTMLTPASAVPYDSIVSAHPRTVRLGLTGHTHMNEFRVYPAAGGAPPIGSQGIPSVTPVYQNNPGFLVIALDGTGGVADYTAYALTNLPAAAAGAAPAWSTLFDFNATYRQSGLSGASLTSVATLIGSDPAVRASWERNYDGGRGVASPNDSTWAAYRCAITHLDPASFRTCWCGSSSAAPAAAGAH